jgi:hypothetical protein
MNAKGSGENREERLQIMLSPDEVRAVDDFRFVHRIPSRAAAVRELLRLGLTSGHHVDGDGTKKSSDFGVLRKVDGGHDGQTNK